tara:strand:- start:41 stop:502 length:462 start_codon:yes stop_codon:yes gene_type:complete
MVTYYLYHILGIKIGATSEPHKRDIQNINQWEVEPIVIENMEGPNTPEMWQVVGDREWELADQYGYPRGNHYRLAREARLAITFEDRSLGGTRGGATNVRTGHFASLKTKEHQATAGRACKGIPKPKTECPKCKVLINNGNLQRHIDRAISCV